MNYEDLINQGGVDITSQFKPPSYEDVLKQGGVDITSQFKVPTYEDTIKEGGVDITDKFVSKPTLPSEPKPGIFRTIKEVAKTVPFAAIRGLEAITAPITAPLEAMGIGTRKMLQESAEYWRPELGGIPNYTIDIDEKFRPSIKRSGDFPISEIVGGTAGAAGFVLGPGMLGMTAGRLVTSLPAIEKVARPFYRDILAGMIGGALTGEGKVDETLQNAALFGMFSALPHLKEVPQTIRNSNIWRRATIKERGLTLQSLEDTIKRNPNMSEGEILRTWNNPAWYQQALSRRVQPEPTVTEPIIPTQVKPVIAKVEVAPPVKPTIKGQEVPLEMVPKELVKPEVRVTEQPKIEVPKPSPAPQVMPQVSRETAKYLELDQEFIDLRNRAIKGETLSDTELKRYEDLRIEVPYWMEKAGISGKEIPPEAKIETNRILEIKKELARLQKQYETKMTQKGREMVPPGIRKDALDGIAKRMDKLDAELKSLEVVPSEAKVEGVKPTEPLPGKEVSPEALPVSDEGVKKGISPRVETVTAPSEARVAERVMEGEKAFTRTTPTKGTSERTSLDEKYNDLSKRADEAYQKIYNLKKERDATKGVFKRDQLSKKLDKLQDVYDKLEKESDPIDKQHLKAIWEDYVETGDPLQRLEAKERLKLITREESDIAQRTLFEDRLYAKGIPSEEMEPMIQDALSSTSKLSQGLNQIVDVAIARVKEPILRGELSKQIEALNLSPRSKERYQDMLRKSSIWPDDMQRIVNQAKQEAGETPAKLEDKKVEGPSPIEEPEPYIETPKPAEPDHMVKARVTVDLAELKTPQSIKEAFEAGKLRYYTRYHLYTLEGAKEAGLNIDEYNKIFEDDIKITRGKDYITITKKSGKVFDEKTQEWKTEKNPTYRFEVVEPEGRIEGEGVEFLGWTGHAPAGAISEAARTKLKEIAKVDPEFAQNPTFQLTAPNQLTFTIGKRTYHFFPSAISNVLTDLITDGKIKIGDTIGLSPKYLEGKQSEIYLVKKGTPTEGLGLASVGTYDVGGGGAAAERPKEPPGRMVNIIEMPEMVELYNELTQGKYPKIKKILRAFRGQATGTYRPGTEKIDLRADIFKDPAQAKAVLAHEIGHLIDDLPDHILKQRGNILGRIASLKKYLKKYLEEYEGAPGPLTDIDKKRLMKDAREALKLEKATAEEQTATFKDMKLTPDDIKAIWNDVEARNKNKPVYDFIVSLSEVEKNQIVREAMRGIVSEANQRRFRISTPIEGRPFKDWDQRLRDIFNTLVKEELEKRRLFTYDNIMGELKNLTTTWKPFTPIPGSTMTKYRFSPQELYADAMSVLFNNPGLLADKAPNFYKGFFNYIHRKPEVKQVYDDIQARIGMGEEAVLEYRREQVQVMFQRGEETLAELRKPEPYNIIEVLRTAFISRREGLLKLKREAQRRGIKIDPEKDPDYWTEELPYISSPIFDMVRDINNTILKPAQAKGISQSDIGEYLLYRREATERAKMANPKGYTEADALKQMDFLKKQIGKERFDYLTDLVKKDWEIREKDIFPVFEKAKVFYPETMDLIKSNEVYTPFQVREHLEQKYGPNVTAKIYRQIGTLKEVINPLTAGVIKDMSLVRMAERKMIAESVVTFLKENFPEQITPAETRWTGKYHDIVDPSDPKLGLIAYTQNGKVTGYYVPKSIANIFSKDPYDFQPILRVLSVIQKPFKEILVSKNPGWWVFNIQRDLKALAKQVPGMDIPRGIKYSVKSLGDAYKDVFKDVSTEDVKAMYQMKALGVGRYWSSSELGPESHLDKIVQSFGETPAKYDLEVLGPYKLIWDYLKAGSMLLDKFGAVGERIPKIAAYKFLKENTSLPDKTISHLIRKRAGSPDFWEKGGLDFLYNNLFWFSNAGKEGIRAALEAAKENPKAYVWKTTKYDILPKLLMLAASAGLLGKTIKDVMDNIPERDKGNYLTIPVGLTSDNKTVYFVMPHDFQGQVVGGMLWKAMRLGKAGDIGGIIDYMSGGLPYTGINPLLGLATDWQQYTTGKNPYDPFRGKYVIPETMFEAGGKEAIEEMLKYSSNQLGGGIVYRFKGRNIEEVKSELEKILGLPVVGNFLNRFIRVSDAGRADELRHISEVVRTERARELIRIDDALGKWVSENYPNIIETPKDIYDQMVKDKSIQRHTYKEFLERLQEIVGYRLGSPEYEAISRARSIEEKTTLILKIMEKGKQKEKK